MAEHSSGRQKEVLRNANYEAELMVHYKAGGNCDEGQRK
jgi:hypothetical protein